MATLEEAFEQFKQLPDWDKYPMPEVFYDYFKVPKPKTGLSVMESLTYTPPPSVSLNKHGRVEIRGPVEGGVREVPLLEAPPVEVKKVNEETGELEDFPPAPEPPTLNLMDTVDTLKESATFKTYMESLTSLINRIADGKTPDSGQTM
jgi:hypothetical protein